MRGRRTTIALKISMALSGLVFIGFVLAHMYGNLMAFGGAEVYNNYAHHLRTFLNPMLPYGMFLVILDIVLVLALAVPVY